MIRYDLICVHGHGFDAWFSSSASFEEQVRKGLIACPVCGDARIEKQLMRPAIPARSNAREDKPQTTDKPALSKGDAAMMRQMAREMHALVRERAEYVGDRFATEARKRHKAGKTDKPIWGEASPKEAGELTKEGIGIMPLPPLPDEKN